MTASRQSPPVECSGHCDRCGMLSVASPMYDLKITGWGLVWRSFVVFLIPLVAAAAGACASGGSPIRQLGGAALGFMGGLIIALAVMRWIRI